MLSTLSRRITVVVLLAGPMAGLGMGEDLRLTGLAMHQETGRDIYLGGVYFDRQIPRPDNLVDASGPKLMAYRVVARRTSVRSLLGGILLQAELATGQAPGDNVARFAGDILASVKGSLYAGDAFEILLTEDDQTIALLNGQELARIDDGRVQDYFLSGWVGEQGPSTAFRSSITAESVDPALLKTFVQTTYSPERGAQVAGWLPPATGPQAGQEPPPAEDASGEAQALAEADTPDPNAPGEIGEPDKPLEPEGALATDSPGDPEEPGELATVAEPDLETLQGAIAEPPGQASGQPEQVLAAASAAPAALAAPAEDPVGQSPAPAAVERAESGAASPPVEALQEAEAAQLAALGAMPGAALPADTTGIDVDVIDIKDYSQRLAAFNTRVMQKVYSQINYPTRAVRRGLEGRVELDVTLEENGQLVEIAVAHSSGYKILDRAAVKAADKGLASMDPDDIDPVAIAEFGGQDSQLVVPVPVLFMLTE